MKANSSLAWRDESLPRSLLRRVADFAGHPALANFTPYGPGSLATGQAGAVARDRCRPGDAIRPRQRPACAGLSHDESATPCRGYASWAVSEQAG